VQPPRQGLGYRPVFSGSLCRGSAYSNFHSLDLEALLARADSLVMQGKIRLLDDLARGDWSWTLLVLVLAYSECLFRFKVNATDNSRPMGDKLCQCGPRIILPLRALVVLSLVRLSGTSKNGCPAFLFLGRYKWRHDAVLRVILSLCFLS
jgi:hypothetical protein